MVHHTAADQVAAAILAVAGSAGDPIASEAPRSKPQAATGGATEAA
jgi:hypothetical protein